MTDPTCPYAKKCDFYGKDKNDYECLLKKPTEVNSLIVFDYLCFTPNHKECGLYEKQQKINPNLTKDEADLAHSLDTLLFFLGEEK